MSDQTNGHTRGGHNQKGGKSKRVTETLNKELSCFELSKTDLDICHRIGRTIGNKPRSVIIKFVASEKS